MAQYKVPQDVEADDKLLGPFTFRQFIYLIIASGFIALAWALFQVFPLLVIIPVPIILFFGALALPLKKDQPMETYLAAIVSFYLKPRKRFWDAGQPESTIEITAPKKAETARIKDISQDEATHRLSFLAEIVDSAGHAIKGSTLSPLREEVYAEAVNTEDMFESSTSTANHLNDIIQSEATARHNELVNQMKTAIETAESLHTTNASIQKFAPPQSAPTAPPSTNPVVVTATPAPTPPAPQNITANQPSPSPNIVNLANDTDLSIETIAKEANRLQQKQNDTEVYVSLH